LVTRRSGSKEELGVVITCLIDLDECEFGDLPEDFDYLLPLSYFRRQLRRGHPSER
jgi:hypothetical protein